MTAGLPESHHRRFRYRMAAPAGPVSNLCRLRFRWLRCLAPTGFRLHGLSGVRMTRSGRDTRVLLVASVMLVGASLSACGDDGGTVASGAMANGVTPAAVFPIDRTPTTGQVPTS